MAAPSLAMVTTRPKPNLNLKEPTPMPTLDQQAYKDALATGKRAAILASARALVTTIGTPQPADAPHVNANFGQDNNNERRRYEKQFNTLALAFTDMIGAYNTAVAKGGNTDPEHGAIVDQLQALESTEAALAEIARIDKGDKFGTGGGLDKVGTPPWAVGLIADVAAIKAKLGV